MSTDSGADVTPALSPDAAFAALGNETRIEILRALAAADAPMSFSEIRKAADLRQGGQLNYHLDKLVDHFVEQNEDGYRLSHTGRRVIEAVFSGAVTESPKLDRTVVDWPCERCGAPVEIRYDQERVERFCTECAGTYSQPTRPDQSPTQGYLGALSLPPAGVDGRSALEMQRAATLWGQLEFLTAVSGVCPSCSATVQYSLTVCGEHDSTDGHCEQCGNRYAVWLELDCTNCIYNLRSSIGGLLVTNAELLEFLGKHGLTPFDPTPPYPSVVWSPEENVISATPFEGEYTFRTDGDAITLTVDEHLSVTNARNHG